jgi:predicted component of type VI protein secretion system
MDYTFVRTRGQVKYVHRNSEISQVRAEVAHCKFAAPSSPEVMHWVMNSYGSVMVIKAAQLAEIYRYLVDNAARLVTTTL